jgi:hypothetical protein
MLRFIIIAGSRLKNRWSASNRDAPELEPPDGARALGEGMDAQQEEVFDSGSDLTDIE